MEELDMAICAECGQSKPLAEFDRRFIGKGCKINCAACRWAKGEPEREQRRRWQEEEERKRREQEAREALERHRLARAVALGFNEREQNEIHWIYTHLGESALSWDEIKRRFDALIPPFFGSGRADRRYIAQSIKHELYVAQQGLCSYCGWPIIAPGEPELVTCLCSACHDQRGEVGYLAHGVGPSIHHCLRGQIDHKTPVTRGGTSEHDNLCYACKGCNQRKGVRTAEEFAQYPGDPITQLSVYPSLIASALRLEARGYNFSL